jgi:DNA invertase Pin-like site-specific DNA recombinase
VTRVVGYSRPLGVDDDLEADAAALRAAGAMVVHLGLGDRKDRVLRSCLDELSAGDVLVVSRAIRLSPSLTHFVSTMSAMGRRGVAFRSIAEPELSAGSRPITTEVYTALESMRSELISIRTRAGMADAAAAGRKLGRPSVMTEEHLAMARELRVHGRSIAHIGQVLGISASTVRRALLDSVS